MGTKPEYNKVHKVALFGGFAAPIRFQLYEKYLVLRAAPDTDEPQERAALEVIARLAESLQVAGTPFHPYERRVTGGPNQVDCIQVARKDVPVNFLPNLPSEVRDRIGIN